jgi:hypothetical protein
MKKVYIRFSFYHQLELTRDPLQSETFSPPNSQQAAKGAQSIPSYHGFAGPVQVTYPDDMYGGPQQPAFVDTMVKLTGINHYKDLNGGTPNCVSITPLVCFFATAGMWYSYKRQSINWHDSDHRSSSATAYLSPVETKRTNWLTLTQHMVHRIFKRRPFMPADPFQGHQN